MNIVRQMAQMFGQLVAGYVLGFGGAFVTQAGDGLQLVLFPAGFTLGVWGFGALAALLTQQFAMPDLMRRLLGTAVGSAVGILTLLIIGPLGFVGILFSLFGALVGYYAVEFIGKKAG